MKKFNKAISFAIAMGVSISSYAAWNGDSTPWTRGDGSLETPFLIENEAHLSYLCTMVNGGETYLGKHFRLTADLDMGKLKMPSIGQYNDYYTEESPDQLIRESKVFRGIFDGNFYTIDNLTVVGDKADNELGGIGLFAITYPETCIRNLTLGENVVVESGGLDNVGGFVGIGTGGKIENCRMLGTVNGGGVNTGGIVGTVQDNVTVDGCVYKGTVNAFSFTGGIIGFAEKSKISNCYFTGKILCKDGFYVAGIVGWALESSVENCYAAGLVEAQTGSEFMPGKKPISAELEKSTAANCFYVEEITGCGQKHDGITAVTEEEMKSPEMVVKLNANQADNTWEAEAGALPVLSWEKHGVPTHIKAMNALCDFTLLQSDNGVNVVSEAGKFALLRLYANTGEMVLSAEVTHGDFVKVPFSGLYIATIETSDGEIKSQKLIF